MCVLSALSPGEEILQLMQSCLPLNLEELRKQEAQLPQEDSEWISHLISSEWTSVESDEDEYFIVRFYWSSGWPELL